MIHYKDRTFCIAHCSNRECIRKYTSDVRQAAVEWWGNDEAPVAIADMSEGCEDIIVPVYSDQGGWE